MLNFKAVGYKTVSTADERFQDGEVANGYAAKEKKPENRQDGEQTEMHDQKNEVTCQGRR